jgi:hypothetical protein
MQQPTAPAPVVPYAAPAAPSGRPSDYPEIVYEAHVLRMFAAGFLFAGWLLLGLGVLWGGGVVYQSVSGDVGRFVFTAVFNVILFGVAPIVAGVVCLLLAALLRTAAAVALAHRDLCVNSFRR